MNPKQARQSLEYILANQKTVSTIKIDKAVRSTLNHNKMLESDNRKLRKRIQRQRVVLRRYEGEWVGRDKRRNAVGKS